MKDDITLQEKFDAILAEIPDGALIGIRKYQTVGAGPNQT
jgi:hypothetical protein